MPRMRIGRLEQCVDEGRDHGTLGQYKEAAEHHHHDQCRQQPELFALPHEPPNLVQKVHADFLSIAFSSEVDTGSREENASKQKDRASVQNRGSRTGLSWSRAPVREVAV